MRAGSYEPRIDPVEALLHKVPFGLVFLDGTLRFQAVTAPAQDLLAVLAHRLVPGNDWSDLVRVSPDPQADVDLSALIANGPVAVSCDKLPDGGLLLSVRAVPNKEQVRSGSSDVIESALEGAWEWHVETGKMRVNDRWIAMLGHSRETFGPITFDAWKEHLHPADRVTLGRWLEQIAKQHTDGFEIAFRLRHATGGWVWVQSRGRVLQWSQTGQPVLIAGLHLDVTAQKMFEHRLEQVIEGAQVGTWQFDEETKTSQINARWAEMLGYSLEEVTGNPANSYVNLLHPDDLPQIMAEQDGRMRDGCWVFDNELRLRHKDGHWVWVLSRGRVTEWSKDGRPLQTSGVHIDISERKALAEALARERNFLAGLMETSTSGIIALDADGKVNFVNREAEVVMGRPASFLIGKKCTEEDCGLTDPDGMPVTWEASPFQLAMRLGQVQRGIKLRLRLPDGTPRHLLVNAAPVRREGFSAAVVYSVTDVTESVTVEATLRRAMQRAEAGNHAKSAFLANMSHEIRTPLNGVLGMADVLAAKLTEPDQLAMLDVIRHSGSHLLQILNDVLDLARIESGHVQLDRQAFSPAELAQRVEAIHGVTARGKGIDLRVLCDSEAQQSWLGDAQRVMQVLHNLVSNAVKFTQTGSVCMTVTARSGGPLAIEIVDTGIGMLPEQTEAMFQEFVQADDTITRRFGGTGLGLPIVRNLVSLMGGRIDLRSAPGQGTRVLVELPLPKAPAVRIQARPVAQNLSRLRALVAEDNGTNRLILRSMLSSLDMGFVVVEDGEQALAQWQPDLFDILLFDIAMPLRDGVSALQAIRARAMAVGVGCPPALAVTANAMTHHVAEYVAAGFSGCVAKPLRLDDLAAAIARAVSEPEPG